MTRTWAIVGLCAAAGVIVVAHLACTAGSSGSVGVLPVDPNAPKPLPCEPDCPSCPIICSVTPATVYNASPENLTLTGKNMAGVVKVWINDTAGTTLSLNTSLQTSTRLVGILPAGVLEGEYKIVVQTSNSVWQTLYPALSVRYFTPPPCGCPGVQVNAFRNVASPAVGDRLFGPVEVEYTLKHPQATSWDIVPQYSVDGGQSWKSAREKPGGTSEGVTGLAAGDPGKRHHLVWDSAQDEANVRHAGFIFRIVVSCCQNTQTTHGELATALDLRNDYPLVLMGAMQGLYWGDVVILFDLVDPAQTSVSFDAEYSLDNGASWKSARRSPRGQGSTLSGIAGTMDATGAGTRYRFLWESATNEPSAFSTQARFRLKRRDLPASTGDWTGVFALDNSRLLTTPSGSRYGAPTVYDLSVVEPVDGVNTIELAAGDFDGDGKDDIVVTDATKSKVYVCFSDGAAFVSPTPYEVGWAPTTAHNQPVNVKVGRLNGDGALDVATWTGFSLDMTPLLNQGGGSFTVGAPMLGVDAAEFNNGQGGFWGTKMDMGDVNGDGTLDLVTVAFHGNVGRKTLGVHLGQGDGTFTTVTQPLPINLVVGVALGEFTGDGIADLVVCSYQTASPPKVVVMQGNGDGSFQSAPIFSYSVPSGVSAYPFKPVTGDFNNDGVDDIVVCMNPNSAGNGTNVYLAMRNKGTGTGFTTDLIDLSAIGSGPSSILAGDFDGDTRPDVAITLYQSHAVALLLNDAAGSGPFLSPSYAVTGAERYPVGAAMGYITQGDIDGDGKLDLAFAQVAGPGQGLLSWIKRK